MSVFAGEPGYYSSRGRSEGRSRRRSRSSSKRRIFSDIPLRWGDLAYGLPALIVACLAISSVGWAGMSEWRFKTYLRESEVRAVKGDYDKALVCLKRLIAFDPLEPRFRYDMAIILDRKGEPQRAEAIMRTIAPESTSSSAYPLADCWLGTRMIQAPKVGIHKAGEVHLLRFLERVPQLDEKETKLAKLVTESKSLLGGYYIEINRFAEARIMLQAAASRTRPDLLIKLSYVCEALKDEVESRRYADEATKLLRSYLERHPNDPIARLNLINALAQLGEYPTAIENLNALAEDLGEKRWRNSMAAVYLDWADHLRAKGPSEDTLRMVAVEEGLRFNPNESRLLVHLNQLLVDDKGGAEKARAMLRSMLVSGKGLAMAHFALGSDAWKRGERQEAREHWEQACRLESETPVIANNLAYILAHEEPVDLNRALALINQALSTASNKAKPLLHGTHGQILVKLKRYPEAVAELELALKGSEKDKRGLHQALAVAYAEIGMKDLATEHQKLER